MLLERNARRERRDVPVGVAISLLAPEAEDVEALGRDDPADGLTDTPDDVLQLQILGATEIACDLFSAFARRDEHVSVQRRIRVEKRDGGVVFVDDVMRELWIAGEQLADEAAIAEPVSDRVEVDNTAAGHASKRMGDRSRKAWAPAAVSGDCPGSGPQGAWPEGVCFRRDVCAECVTFLPQPSETAGVQGQTLPTLESAKLRSVRPAFRELRRLAWLAGIRSEAEPDARPGADGSRIEPDAIRRTAGQAP